MNLVGSVLAGRYEIVKEIGSGGMAIVYKAKCKILNRYVAIKVLRPDLKDDNDFVRRFNIEAQAAASLTHPNIVSIYDVGTEGDFHYIVMEYVEGITLKEYIDENVLLNWHEAVGYAIQIASGLEQAHKNSIVHRDIKPHNIIMTHDGVLKITDFGIARASIQSTVTCDDNAIGSVHYVSPEQARGGYVDERSDIYSLGIVLYEMLTGKVPFDNESPVSIALMHLQSAPTPPREHNISIPKMVEDIVIKAMCKEVSGRYKSVTEFKNELIAVAESTIPTPVPDKKEDEEIDELGGTAIFTAAKDIPVSYENNQAPSAKSNLIPKEETEHTSAPDIELIEDEDEEEIIMPRKSNKKKNNTVNVIIILLALIASAVIIWGVVKVAEPIFSDLFGSGEDTLKIPELIGRDISDIENDPELAKHYNFEKEYASDHDYRDGIVIKQNPSPDTEMAKKDGKITITLTINSLDEDEEDSSRPDKPEKDVEDEEDEGKEESEPLGDYVGKKYDNVKSELKEKYGEINKKEEYSSEVLKGYIISQSVEEGETLKKGEKLTITVSKGKKPDGDDPEEEKPEEDEEETPAQPYRKRLSVYGPTDKDSALVDVKVNGKSIKSFTLAKGESEVVTIQSTLSTVTVEIYHDGELVHTETVKMKN